MEIASHTLLSEIKYYGLNLTERYSFMKVLAGSVLILDIKNSAIFVDSLKPGMSHVSRF